MPLKDPEKLREYRRQYRLAHPIPVEKRREWEAKYREKHRDDLAATGRSLQTASYRRQKRYGLTPERFEALMESQGNLCACCRLKPPVDVDHDHEARFVRGLLCRACNLGIGMFADSPAKLREAALYLELAIPIDGIASKEKKSPRAISKATAEMAAQIRKDYAEGLGSYPVLARKYGLHAVTVGTIVRGEVWQINEMEITQ